MNDALRKFLVSNGMLAEGATTRQAWLAYGQAVGRKDLREEAITLRGDGTAPKEDESQDNEPTQRSETAQSSTTTTETPDQVRAAERQRIAQIRALAPEGVSDQVVQDAIDSSLSPEEAARSFLEAAAPANSPIASGQAPGAYIPGSERSIEALATGFAIRAGADPIRAASHFFCRRHSVVGSSSRRPIDGQQERNAECERLAHRGEEYADMSLIDVCREALMLSGRPVPGSSRSDLVRAAVSTGSLSNIMSPALNARLMASFEGAPDTTGPFTREVDGTDFRKRERHDLGKMANPQKRLRGGTAKAGTISDRAPEEYRVFEYAQTDRIDRQDIIDDRLDVFQDWPDAMGDAFAQLRPDLVYFILLKNANMADGNPLFDNTTHGNSASSALGHSALSNVISKLIKQQQDGRTLNIQPANLITGAKLADLAAELVGSPQITITGSTDDVRGIRNTLTRHGISPIADGRIDNGVTDPDTGETVSGSTTAWFLTGSPARVPIIEVGYVAGLGRMPEMVSRTLNGEGGAYGVEWSMSHAVGAKALHWLGVQRGNS